MAEKWKQLEEEFPEEIVFSLADLVQFYEDNAETDERIKEFVEKIKDCFELQTYLPIHYFQISQ